MGLHKRLLNNSKQIIDDLSDEDSNDNVDILTIRLQVTQDLEPKWYVINNRENQDFVEIKANDRAKLNVFLVSDYLDRHFSWSKGNPLYSLLKQEASDEKKSNVIIDAFREAKEKIDKNSFNHLDKVLKKVETTASGLGVDISNTTTTIDFKDISIREGKICLHDEKIPFRQKGKGSKRLVSIAIQMELAEAGGILLIDEIEQGLEPDRAQHLAKTLKQKSNGQVFITTHSRDVLVELNASDIYKIKKNAEKLFIFDSSLQACIRSNPESLFSNRILVCEGPTEIGICRAMNDFRISNGSDNISFLGIRFANGNGSSQIEYVNGFLKAGYDVALFCDSDVESINNKKETLRENGVLVIDCDDKNATENQVFSDLPWNGIKELIEYKISEIQESVEDSVKASYKKHGELPIDWKETDTDTEILRCVLGKTAKKKSWFKRIGYAEFLGTICLKYLTEIKGKKLGKQFENLSKWIDNV